MKVKVDLLVAVHSQASKLTYGAGRNDLRADVKKVAGSAADERCVTNVSVVSR